MHSRVYRHSLKSLLMDQKKCVKNLGWAVKKWSKRHFLSLFWEEMDKIIRDNKDAQGVS